MLHFILYNRVLPTFGEVPHLDVCPNTFGHTVIRQICKPIFKTNKGFHKHHLFTKTNLCASLDPWSGFGGLAVVGTVEDFLILA